MSFKLLIKMMNFYLVTALNSSYYIEITKFAAPLNNASQYFLKSYFLSACLKEYPN